MIYDAVAVKAVQKTLESRLEQLTTYMFECAKATYGERFLKGIDIDHIHHDFKGIDKSDKAFFKGSASAQEKLRELGYQVTVEKNPRPYHPDPTQDYSGDSYTMKIFW